MPRHETVCKYCGVSYLILHEFKVMEEKVKAMEKKIKCYEGSLEREKGLQAELQALYKDLERYRADRESKTERIKTLTVELKTKQDELKNVKDDLRYFQEEKEAVYKQSHVLRNTLEHHCSTLSKVVSLFPFIRSELNSIREVISSSLESWTATREEIFLQIKTVSKEALTDWVEMSGAAVVHERGAHITWGQCGQGVQRRARAHCGCSLLLYGNILIYKIPKLNQRLAKTQRENECLQEKVKHLTVMADMVELKTQQLQTSLQQGNELQSRCRELQKETLDLTNQVETAGLKLQKVTAEMDHYKKLLMVKSTELDVCQNELKKIKSENGISESSELEALKSLLAKTEEEVAMLKQE
ncbi:PREDICTED: protein Daple-like, partial [Mesitornis unicolor]|uniref:protein Daple-like n=1 Tax=Mesitornis unicolor TaxID=54374 RepID=UPI000528C7D0